MAKTALQSELDSNGFALIREHIPENTLTHVIAELNGLTAATATRRGRLFAARNLLENLPAVADLASSSLVLAPVHAIMGGSAFAVRAILFDKVPGANWHVGWHQDQVIAVRERKDVSGFSAWSVKEGVPHVRPPAEVLEQMLTLRIHLDDCNQDNGALRVIPGSHCMGILDDDQIAQAAEKRREVVCEARRGSVLAMRPLVLHSSSPATTPSHRRVLHLEFASQPLPDGLEWPVCGNRTVQP